jgi:hypothetical protein
MTMLGTAGESLGMDRRLKKEFFSLSCEYSPYAT